MPKKILGVIALDTNGDDEPNVARKDQFYFPVGLNGIEYEHMCAEFDEEAAEP